MGALTHCRGYPLSLPAAQITEEQRVKAELQQQVDNLRARIADQRLQMGGLNNSKDQEAKVWGSCPAAL